MSPSPQGNFHNDFVLQNNFLLLRSVVWDIKKECVMLGGGGVA